MAKTLESFTFSRATSNRESQYDWKNWFNGSLWALTQGEDFTCKLTTFRSLARTAAKKQGLELKTGVTETDGKAGIVIQAIKPKAPEAPSAPTAPDANSAEAMKLDKDERDADRDEESKDAVAPVAEPTGKKADKKSTGKKK